VKGRGHVLTEEHGYGKLRSRAVIPSEKLKYVIDHATYFGWHECNDRYFVHRDNVISRVRDYLLIFTLNGEGRASVGDREYRPTRGTVMIFPKDVKHSYGVAPGGQWKFYWMHVNGNHCGAMLDHMAEEYGSLIEVSCMEELASDMEKLMDSELDYHEYELFAAKTVGEMLYRILGSAMNPSGAEKKRAGLAVQVIDLIERNGARPIRLEEIAAQMYLSPEHIIRTFRKETGITPCQYMKRQRMRRACLYLEESGMSVEEVAHAAGYQSVSTFIAQFRQRYGTTPGGYRLSRTGGEKRTGEEET